MHKIVSFATVAALSACGERTAPQKGQAMAAPVLRRNVAAICEPAVAYPFLLDLPARGGFKLNMVPFDSIQLTRWFEVQLAKRIPAQRVVMVRLDSTRRNELRWLIPAIERAGAGAYQPDSTCVPPARIQAADAPAA